MSVVLDTEVLTPDQRADALQDSFRGEVPQRVTFARDAPVRLRVDLVELGPGVRLRHNLGEALHVERTERHVRLAAPEFVFFGLQRQGRSLLTLDGTTRPGRDDELECVDSTRPYALRGLTPSARDDLILDLAELRTTVDVVRVAAPAITASPLYPLFRRHVAGLFAATVGLDPDARRLVGEATTTLARALLLSAAGDAPARGALVDTLDLRVRDHVERHLHERDLTVERLATALHVSVRHLYNVWARSGHELTPAEWIMTRRLDRARRLLEATGTEWRGVEDVARRCGFADVSHFGRRFRQAFGTSPGAWREQHRVRVDGHVTVERRRRAG